jgi:hypothetical protein
MVFLFLMLLGQSGHAGPWLREQGTTFSALSVSSTYYLNTTSQTYLEYGLTAKTTVIADISMAQAPFAPQVGTVTASFRRALSKPDAQSKWAYELGLGVGWIGEQTLPHVRTALSWGKGISLGDTSGWLAVDAAVLWDVTYALHVGKIDTTFGLNFTEVTSGMIQIYSAFAAGESIVTISPSLVFKPKGKKFSLLISTESEIDNFENTALKIGLWREF